MQKINIAILGPGNVGMNLLYKVMHSPYLECICLAGRNKSSKNLLSAKGMGIYTSDQSIDAIINLKNKIDIVFDATNAEAHIRNSKLLKNDNIFMIDLTPSRLGKLCLPCINGEECLNYKEVNMITCGGQSMVPVANAISKVSRVKYVEVVSTIPACSAGEGTRQNIDEYIMTTRRTLLEFSNAEKAKAMLVLNPADPPVIMRNTIYAILEKEISINYIIASVKDAEKKVRKYVPGYEVITPPTYIKKNTVAISVQVRGSGDFLPDYAGNLDIITCAGIEMAEKYAKSILGCV